MKKLREPRIYEEPPCGSIFLISRECDLLGNPREVISRATNGESPRSGAGGNNSARGGGKFVKREI
jgi:hypothetical protein